MPDNSDQPGSAAIQQLKAFTQQPASQTDPQSQNQEAGQYQLVNVPGVGQLRFPAGMSQTDMAAAIQRNFPQIHGQAVQGVSPNAVRFDLQGALKAGYSPAEVADYFGQQSKFDVAGARKAGYSDQEIISHLTQAQNAARPTIPFVPAPPTSAESFDAGTGKAFVDVGRGAKQLALQWGHKLGLVSNSELSDYQQELAQDRAQDAPLMATTAGKVGNIVGNVAMAAAVPEEAGLAGAVGSGAALSGVQPTVGDESRLANTALGAAGGLAGDIAGRVLGRVAQPIRNVLDNSRQQAIQILKDAGVPLDVAQATGAKVATTLKNVASDSPLINESKFPGVQQQAYNAAVLRTFGASGTKATPAIMDAADKRIGAMFDDIAHRNPVAVDQPLLDSLANIHTAADRELSSAEAAPIKSQVNNIIDKAAGFGGQLGGKAYQAINSSLGRLSRNNANGSIRYFAGEIRSSLDDALQRSVSAQDLDTLMSARRQYRAMKQVEDAIQTGTDDVSPAALVNAIDRKANASQSVYGRGDQTLVQLGNAGKLILGKGHTPNSGTTRRFLGYMATGMGGDAIYRIARGQSIDKDDIMEAAIAGGFAPMAARALIESPAGRQWLTKWANSTVAQRAAGAALRSGRVAGAGLGAGSLSAPSSSAS